MVQPIRIATRGSALAVAQSSLMGHKLTQITGRPFELHTVQTVGDVTSGSLTSFGGVGVFVGAVRQAVLAGEADVCVHSLKDLPTAPHPGLEIVAIPERESPADCLVGATLDQLQELPQPRIGTGSPRRARQLRALLPAAEIVDIRGNIDTRIELATQGDLSAVVLAESGLNRLGRQSDIAEAFSPDVFLPAPGQGALALEMAVPAADADLVEGVTRADHGITRQAVVAERTVLAELEAGCSAPIAAFARWDGQQLTLTAAVLAEDGTQVAATLSGPLDGSTLGSQMSEVLVSGGAQRILG